MRSNEELKRLLEEFISGKISRNDAEELFNIINNQDIDDQLKAWLYKKWDESPTRSKGFHSEGIYEQIRTKLNFPAKSTREEKDYIDYLLTRETPANKRVFRYIFRYAAIFILAMAASYFLLRQTEPVVKTAEESYTEIKTENGSKSTIILPDSSVVKLNSGSTLRYPDQFTGKNRQVFLEGEAFFNVTHGKASPFYVRTGNISIMVLGTQFNVKSFPEEQYIETTLISGKIIINDNNRGSSSQQQTVLNPNQLAVYNKKTSKLDVLELIQKEEVTSIRPVRVTSEQLLSKNVHILTAWKDDKLVFYNERFDDLALRLERWYNVEITIADEELKGYRFAGSFTTEDIEQAMDALKLASSFEYRIDKNKITVNR